ncbi:MAG: hypothetical protein ACR2P0_16395 [Acidimicrobiales bacterium]
MSTESVVIDCDSCVMQNTDACEDCVVTYLCDREPEQAVVINIADLRAMRALADVGLVPELRHQAR